MTYPYPIDPGFSPPSLFRRRRPSILDRLFPDPTSGALEPGALQGVQRQGLLQLGASLMQAGGPQAVQRGFLANVGAGIQGLDLQGMAQNALRVQAYRQQEMQGAAQRQALDALRERHKGIQDPYERIRAMMADAALMPGAEHLIGPLSNALAQLKPDASRNEWSQPLPATGADGRVHLYQVRRDTGETRVLDISPVPKEPKEPTPVERTAGSQWDSASESVRNMEAIAQRNPQAAKAAVAAIRAGGWGKLGKAYGELRGFTNDPDAQAFFTEYKNMILTVTPTYGGARPTQQLMDLEQAATLPALGSGDFEPAFRHMQHRLDDLHAKAGRAAPRRQAPATPAPKPGQTVNPFGPGGQFYVAP